MPTPLSLVELDRLEAILDGTHVPPPVDFVDPETAPLYAALAGIELETDHVALLPGLSLTRAYLHVFSPFMAAYARPANNRAPHPGPWRPAGGGLAIDVLAEISLAQNVKPFQLDRLNTLWLVASLFRLASASPVFVPLVSNVSIAQAALPGGAPTFWPVEMGRGYLSQNRLPGLAPGHLEWVIQNISAAGKVINDPIFNRAYRMLDAVWSLPSPTARLIAIWTSLETLLRPGFPDTGKKLARKVADYLEADNRTVEKTRAAVLALYRARGSSAHDGQEPQATDVAASYRLARRVFMRRIEETHGEPGHDLEPSHAVTPSDF